MAKLGKYIHDEQLEIFAKEMIGDGNKKNNIFFVSISNYVIDNEQEDDQVFGKVDPINCTLQSFTDEDEAIEFADSIKLIPSVDKPTTVTIEDRLEGEIYLRQLEMVVKIKYEESQMY